MSPIREGHTMGIWGFKIVAALLVSLAAIHAIRDAFASLATLHF